MGLKLTLRKEEKEILNDAEEKVKKNGFDGICKTYKDKLDEWKGIPLKFVITGSSHLRKSFLGSEKTFEEKYGICKGAKVELCRRFGTEDFENFKEFRNEVGDFDKYDAFLIFCKPQLTDNEKKLVEKLSKNFHKPYVFIVEDDEKKGFKSLEDFAKDVTDIYDIDMECENFGWCKDILSMLIKRCKRYFKRCLNRTIFKNEEITERNRIIEEIKYVVEKRGVKDTQKLRDDLNESMKKTKILFALVGRSGTGKSTFINALRGLRGYEIGAAKAGYAKTTREPSKYFHPEIPEIILWDLPGLGSPELPNVKEFCQKIDLKKCDLFLLFSRARFTQLEKELAEKVSKELKKPFFFVRTNVHYDLKNAMIDDGPNFNEESTRKKTIEESYDHLKDLIKDKTDIFLIDNKHTDEYDFQRLKDSIANTLLTKHDDDDRNLSELISMLKNETEEAIEFKAELLIGAASRTSVFLRIPFSFYKNDEFTNVVKIIDSYRVEFGLENAIEQNSKRNGKNVSKQRLFADKFINKFAEKTVKEINEIEDKEVPDKDGNKDKDAEKEAAQRKQLLEAAQMVLKIMEEKIEEKDEEIKKGI